MQMMREPLLTSRQRTKLSTGSPFFSCVYLVWFVCSPVPLHGLLVKSDMTIVDTIGCLRLPHYMSFLAKFVVGAIGVIALSNFLATMGMVAACIWTAQVHVGMAKNEAGFKVDAWSGPGEMLVYWLRWLLVLVIVRGFARWVVHWSADSDSRHRDMEAARGWLLLPETEAWIRSHHHVIIDTVNFTLFIVLSIVMVAVALHTGAAQDLAHFNLEPWQPLAVCSICFWCCGSFFCETVVKLVWMTISHDLARDAGKIEAIATIGSMVQISAGDPRLAQQDCCICLGRHDQDVHGLGSCATSCGHTFHLGCLSEWVETLRLREDGLTCPVCKTSLTSKPAEQIV